MVCRGSNKIRIFIPHPNFFLVQIMRYFQMDKLCKLSSDKGAIPLVGIDNSVVGVDSRFSFVKSIYLLWAHHVRKWIAN
jgi:hypothetical protein